MEQSTQARLLRQLNAGQLVVELACALEICVKEDERQSRAQIAMSLSLHREFKLQAMGGPFERQQVEGIDDFQTAILLNAQMGRLRIPTQVKDASDAVEALVAPEAASLSGFVRDLPLLRRERRSPRFNPASHFKYI